MRGRTVDLPLIRPDISPVGTDRCESAALSPVADACRWLLSPLLSGGGRPDVVLNLPGRRSSGHRREVSARWPSMALVTGCLTVPRKCARRWPPAEIACMRSAEDHRIRARRYLKCQLDSAEILRIP